MVDAPPVTTKVFFVSVTSTTTSLRPGRYGIEVTAVVRNELAVDITGVETALTFAGRDKELRSRDADRRDAVMVEQPATIAAGGEATFRFVVDALPWLAAMDVQINGTATFQAGTMKLSATALQTPLKLQYTGINSPIVVNFAGDEDDNDTQISLREAIRAANLASGPDRIVFDPSVFSAGTTITLSDSLGELPTIASNLVIDAGDAGVTLAVTSAWEAQEGRYGLRITVGDVVVAGLTFKNFAYGYRNEGITTGNCGDSDSQLEGGAIRIDGGTVVLESNRFEDPDVAERNCYAASVRIHGGSHHRIVGNTWTDQVMDSIFVGASTFEITDNVMNAPANPDRTDDGVYVSSLGNANLWIVGNLIVDNEYSAVRSGGTDSGRLYIVNNTFVRNGRTGMSAVRREQSSRVTVLRNNLYIANTPTALQLDNSGIGFDIAYETITDNPLCSGSCGSAVVDLPTIDMQTDPGVANLAGSTRAELTPLPDSPLVNTATPWLDRNAGAPRHFSGIGQERGAVELP